MKEFVDATGTTRSFHITIGAARKFAQLDLIDGSPEEILEAIKTRPLLRLDMMWHYLVDRPENREEFEDALYGQALIAADEALWGEIVFFIQSLRPEMAGVLETMVDKWMKLTARQMEITLEFADSEEFQKATDEKMDSLRQQALAKLSSAPVDSLE